MRSFWPVLQHAAISCIRRTILGPVHTLLAPTKSTAAETRTQTETETGTGRNAEQVLGQHADGKAHATDSQTVKAQSSAKPIKLDPCLEQVSLAIDECYERLLSGSMEVLSSVILFLFFLVATLRPAFCFDHMLPALGLSFFCSDQASRYPVRESE